MTDPEKTITWIKEFFSHPNEILFDDLENGSFRGSMHWCEKISKWLELGQSTQWREPIILPLVRSNEKTIWFASALDSKIAAQLGPELLAHIGPSFSDFSGDKWRKNRHNPSFEIILNNLNNAVYKFSPSKEENNSKIAQYLEYYRHSLERRPPRRQINIASGQYLRSEFDLALLLGDEQRATTLKQSLIASGRLSAENQQYLTIRFLAGLGKYEDLLKETEIFNGLAGLNIPKQVLQDIMFGWYDQYVKSIDNGEFSESHLEEFKNKTRDFNHLFQTRKGLSDPKTLKTFLLYDVCHRDIDQETYEKHAKNLPNPNPFLETLQKYFTPAHATSETLESARKAYDEHDYDLALSLFLEEPPTIETINKVLVCCAVIDTQEVLEKVCVYIDGSEIDVDNDLKNPIKETYLKAKSSREGSQTRVESWFDWLRLVESGNDHEDAVRLIDEESATWSVQDIITSDDAADTLGIIAENHPDLSQKAMIKILSGIEDEGGIAGNAAKDFLHSLLLINFLSSSHSEQVLEIINQLTSAYLTKGLDADEYQRFVGDVKELFEKVASQNNMSWAMDLLDIMAINPCPNASERLSFFAAVLGFADRQIHRMDLAQYNVLKFLSHDFEETLPEKFTLKAQELSQGEDQQDNIRYDHIKIGIYTLMTSAGSRAKEILSSMYPGISIDTNDDHVCTDRLKALAKSADLFVFASRSSKHQAFFCIKDHRPKNDLLVQPPGKGSASIVRSVEQNVISLLN